MEEIKGIEGKALFNIHVQNLIEPANVEGLYMMDMATMEKDNLDKMTKLMQGEEKMNDFTIEQIKKAFWLTFHQSGDLWFPYIGNSEIGTEAETECNEATEDMWIEFLENLGVKEEAPKE